ncbi:MAG: DUF554 domain-containing protein [Peptococcaceae bacterium]
MLGTIVNVTAIIIGSLLGLALKKGIPENYKETILQGIGSATILIGLKMGFKANNELIIILSLVMGGIIGEVLRIEFYLDELGHALQRKVGSQEGEFVKAFVSASLIMCVGAMALLGAMESGITGTHKILFAKSALDFIMATVLSSSMGIGVIFAAIPVFVYQGVVTILAAFVKNILTDQVIAYMAATGGMLIVGIGLNILGIKKINIANLLPAIFIAIIITIIGASWFPNYL